MDKRPSASFDAGADSIRSRQFPEHRRTPSRNQRILAENTEKYSEVPLIHRPLSHMEDQLAGLVNATAERHPYRQWTERDSRPIEGPG
jgi:hypothetical protein